MSYFKFQAYAAFSLVLFGSLAWAGEKGGNGGDPVIERERRIKAWIEADPLTGKSALRERALKLVTNNPTWSAIRDQKVRTTLAQMSEKGALYWDIAGSRYEVREACIDQSGNSVPATAFLNENGGVICFNAKAMAAINASKNELLALLFHEHAHHFGHIDPWMSINAAILDLLEREKPSIPPLFCRKVTFSLDSTDDNVSISGKLTDLTAPSSHSFVMPGIFKFSRKNPKQLKICSDTPGRVYVFGYNPRNVDCYFSVVVYDTDTLEIIGRSAQDLCKLSEDDRKMAEGWPFGNKIILETKMFETTRPAINPYR